MKILTALLAVAALSSTGCGDDAGAQDLAMNIVDMSTGAGRDMIGSAGDGGGMAKMFSVTLNKISETPPCTSAGATAMGSATVTLDAAESMITVSNFTYTGLSGTAMMAHIHAGAVGVSGPVVFSFGSALSSPINKSFTAADYPATPAAGAPANFAAFVSAMKAGGTYINVHTTACGSGEIRGQIM